MTFNIIGLYCRFWGQKDPYKISYGEGAFCYILIFKRKKCDIGNKNASWLNVVRNKAIGWFGLVRHSVTEWEWLPNKALHWRRIPLRSILANELDRSGETLKPAINRRCDGSLSSGFVPDGIGINRITSGSTTHEKRKNYNILKNINLSGWLSSNDDV